MKKNIGIVKCSNFECKKRGTCGRSYEEKEENALAKTPIKFKCENIEETICNFYYSRAILQQDKKDLMPAT